MSNDGCVGYGNLISYNNVMKQNDHKQNRKRNNSQSTAQKLPPLTKKQNLGDRPALQHISFQDEGIISLLYEYFIKNNFLDALDSFQKDCFEKGFKPNNKFIDSFKQEIIQAFDHGNRQVFMARFAQYVPISIRNRDSYFLKLQFFIQIYFYVYSTHPYLGKKRNVDPSAKQHFSSYLQGKGSTLVKSAQFLQFYALVSIPKPQQHHILKRFFTKEWVTELRTQLVEYLDRLYTSNKNPTLSLIYQTYIEKNMEKNSQQSITEPDDEFEIEEVIEPEESQILAPTNNNNEVTSRAQEVPQYQSFKHPNAFENTDREKESMSIKIAELEEEKNELIKYWEDERKKYQTLQHNYKDFTEAAQNTLMESQSKWFKITQQFYNMASSLKDACVKLQNSLPLDDPTVVEKIGKKLSKYESFVKMNIEDLISENVDFSLFERPEHDLSTDLVRKNNDERPQFLIQLDFDKIKAVLYSRDSSSDLEKCALLESLKWRLTKTKGALFKREVALSFVINDIFNIKKGDESIKALLGSASKSVLMSTMQFLNAFTKDFYGRKYLSCEEVVKNALVLLKNQKMEPNIVVITISFLQQLSVRKNAQQMMIEGDLIKWIVTKLRKQRETMSEYLMEYSLATIINLLLKKQGLQKSEEIKQEILTTLIDLMEIDLIDIREYVHGAIYPLFHKRVFREKAKQYGLEANIKFLLENTQSDFLINQLHHLEKQLMREDQEQEEENDEEEDMDDIFDEEYGQDFDFEAEADSNVGLSGEELLMKKYPLTGPDAIRQLNMVREEAEVTLKNKSVYVASNFSERPPTNNIVMRKNVSNDNSVYSNKSSSRVLKSELMNRSQLKNQQANRGNDPPIESKKQMSIKDFIEEVPDSRNEFPVFRKEPSEQVIGSRAREAALLQNDSFNQKNAPQSQQQIQNSRGRGLKPYEDNQEYQLGFKTRSALPRTPPQK